MKSTIELGYYALGTVCFFYLVTGSDGSEHFDVWGAVTAVFDAIPLSIVGMLVG